MLDQTGHGQNEEQCSFFQHQSHLTAPAAENIANIKSIPCIHFFISSPKYIARIHQTNQTVYILRKVTYLKMSGISSCD